MDNAAKPLRLPTPGEQELTIRRSIKEKVAVEV